MNKPLDIIFERTINRVGLQVAISNDYKLNVAILSDSCCACSYETACLARAVTWLASGDASLAILSLHLSVYAVTPKSRMLWGLPAAGSVMHVI